MAGRRDSHREKWLEDYHDGTLEALDQQHDEFANPKIPGNPRKIAFKEVNDKLGTSMVPRAKSKKTAEIPPPMIPWVDYAERGPRLPLIVGGIALFAVGVLATVGGGAAVYNALRPEVTPSVSDHGQSYVANRTQLNALADSVCDLPQSTGKQGDISWSSDRSHVTVKHNMKTLRLVDSGAHVTVPRGVHVETVEVCAGGAEIQVNGAVDTAMAFGGSARLDITGGSVKTGIVLGGGAHIYMDNTAQIDTGVLAGGNAITTGDAAGDENIYIVPGY